MKFNLILLLIIICIGCSNKNPSKSYVEKIGAISPASTITDFWFSGIGMDHCYLWRIQFEDEPAMDAYISGLLDFESCDDGISKDTGLGDSGFPVWFTNDKIKELDGIRKNSNGRKTNIYIFIDKASKILLVEWFDT